MKTRIPLLFFLIFALDVAARAAPLVSIEVSTDGRVITDFSGVLLSGGSPFVDGDGTVVQVGYHPGATVGHNFGPAGTTPYYDFVPLIGEGAATGIKLTIGDAWINGTANGEVFVDELHIFAGTNGLVLSPVGTPLVIRFYDRFSLASSTAFEEVSNDLWLWQTPLSPPSQPLLFLNLDDSGLIALSRFNVAAPGKNIKVQSGMPFLPEPSSFLLLVFGGGTLLSRRIRKGGVSSS